jgi:pimeloyl-ACP methyl ester carboxylesterase
MSRFNIESAVFHHDTLYYVDEGSGPPIILIHGLLGSHESWGPQIELLSRKYRVIAPDLYGAGLSDKPDGDYSLSAHSATIRDLMDHLGIWSAPLIGHSHGGGVAMQFLYLFPERVDSLCLVCSGGLGREVSILLRAASLPGSELVLPILAWSQLRSWTENAARMLTRLGPFGRVLRISASTQEIWRTFGIVAEGRSRAAFLATTRAVLGPFGQNIDARKHFGGYGDLRALVIWGEKDRMIPVKHLTGNMDMQSLLPRAEFEVIQGAGHFPHLDDPRAFYYRLDEFLSAAQEPPLHKTG